MADKKRNVTLKDFHMEVQSSTDGIVVLKIIGSNKDLNEVSFSLTKENIKWLRTALKQANALAFK